MNTPDGRPIVVGVDGSQTATEAVRWACRRALSGSEPVRLVSAVRWSRFQPMGLPALGQERYREAALEVAATELEAAVSEARLILPADKITSEVVGGNADEVLHDESTRASLVVVGNRGRGGFGALLLGSVAVTTAATAQCPTVVIRGVVDSGGPVVVGVGGSGECDAALAFAFDEAQRRKAPLTAVRAWAEEVIDPYFPELLDPVALERDESKALAQALAQWRGKYPEVSVRPRVVHDPAAGALVEESSSAQLVVVGSRGRAGLAGLLLGSVSQAVLHHAQCPVAVARAVGPSSG